MNDEFPSPDGDQEWLPPTPQETTEPTGPPPADANRRARWLRPLALVAAGAVVGGGIAAAVSHDSTNASAATAPGHLTGTGQMPGIPSGSGAAPGDGQGA